MIREILALLSLMISILSVYLYSSISFPMLLSRKAIRGEGLDVNSVTTVAEAFRSLGLKTGLLAATGELFKVLLAFTLARLFFKGRQSIKLLLATCALLGTRFPYFAAFRERPANTIAIWTLNLLAPWSAAVLGAIWLFFRMRLKEDLAGMVTNLLMPAVILLLERNLPLTAFGAFASFLSLSWYGDRLKDDNRNL